MNIALIDDCAADRALLEVLIKQYDKDYSVDISLKTYVSGEDFLANANIHELDAVFLDIFMDKLNGMEVAQTIRDLGAECSIIFVTTTQDYAVRSYEVRALNYLLKPVDKQRLDIVMQQLVCTAANTPHFIVVKQGREMRKILLSDILYVDYYNHYVQLHTKTETIATYSKFAEYEMRLGKYPEFLTCYRCIMVNMKQIEKTEEKFFLMTNGEYVPINRNKAPEIKMKYSNYIFGNMSNREHG